MQRSSRPRPKTAARSVLSQALVLLTLVAFTLQGFVTQTHIHVRPVGAPVAVDWFDGGVPAKDPGTGKAPKNDEANCPLCQAFASAGNFVTPAVAATLLPTFSVSVIDVVVHATATVSAVTHGWRGRAPPQG